MILDTVQNLRPWDKFYFKDESYFHDMWEDDTELDSAIFYYIGHIDSRITVSDMIAVLVVLPDWAEDPKERMFFGFLTAGEWEEVCIEMRDPIPHEELNLRSDFMDMFIDIVNTPGAGLYVNVLEDLLVQYFVEDHLNEGGEETKIDLKMLESILQDNLTSMKDNVREYLDVMGLDPTDEYIIETYGDFTEPGTDPENFDEYWDDLETKDE